MSCRRDIIFKKIWADENNAYLTRPAFVEIVLLRDGEVYKTAVVTSDGHWVYTFRCLPVWNKLKRYEYRIDELETPTGYTKSIDGFNITNTLIKRKILLTRATAVMPVYMAAPNTWQLNGTISPDLYMFDKILLTLPYPSVTVKWAYGIQDEAYFRSGGGTDITDSYQDGIPAPLNTDYTVYVSYAGGADEVAHINIDHLRDGSEKMPYLLIDFTTADTLEPLIPGMNQFTLYYMQGNGIKLKQHYEIYESIDMSGKTWEPLSPLDMTEIFTGSLYGNGNDITNLTVGEITDGDYIGLFRYIGDGASIQSLNLVNCNVQSYYIASGFTAYAWVEKGGSVLLKDLHFNGVLKSQEYSGAIVGIAVANNGSLAIEGCTVNGNIESTDCAGGISGYFSAGTNGSLSANSCHSFGVVNAENNAAGIVAKLSSEGSITILNCFNATAVHSNKIAGGIAGIADCSGYAAISSCYNKGNISSGTGGGIVGGDDSVSKGSFSIINCYNSGTVTATAAGGIYGYRQGSIYVRKSYNIGDVISTDSGNYYAGGISVNYGNIINCAALNKSVSSYFQAARISPMLALDPTLYNNVAFDNMQVLINGVQKFPLDTGSAGTDGISETAASLKTQTLYENTLEWDFTNIWNFGNGNYTLPVLRNIPAALQPVVLPQHLE